MFNARTLPIYAAFLVWGTGTGAQNLARPLFAFELEGSIFLVTVLLASSAIARLVASPITGFMTDRWGRRPLLIMGAGIRGATGILSFFAGSYMEFFVLEFIGGVGIAMWNTQRQHSNRGRDRAAHTRARRRHAGHVHAGGTGHGAAPRRADCGIL